MVVNKEIEKQRIKEIGLYCNNRGTSCYMLNSLNKDSLLLCSITDREEL